MQAELMKLEADWLHVLQSGDSGTLDGLLDSAFVSSPWHAPNQLLLRDAYLREANHAQLRGCELTPVYVEVMGNFAIVKCRIACEYDVNGRKWVVELSITDIWVHREDGWKALNRDASGRVNSKQY
ncbi:MAG: nuclear transport factor 2 family protein [Terriglobia bacterium]|nr:nuclear transport factor 2 family protein [Terriglobia bacterium]